MLSTLVASSLQRILGSGTWQDFLGIRARFDIKRGPPHALPSPLAPCVSPSVFCSLSLSLSLSLYLCECVCVCVIFSHFVYVWVVINCVHVCTCVCVCVVHEHVGLWNFLPLSQNVCINFSLCACVNVCVFCVWGLGISLSLSTTLSLYVLCVFSIDYWQSEKLTKLWRENYK